MKKQNNASGILGLGEIHKICNLLYFEANTGEKNQELFHLSWLLRKLSVNPVSMGDLHVTILLILAHPSDI